MSRYIDAEILKERLIKNITLTNAIDRSFNEAPSIDIVRCKECRYCDYVDMKTHLWCDYQEHYVLADDFCSYGERKDQ